VRVRASAGLSTGLRSEEVPPSTQGAGTSNDHAETPKASPPSRFGQIWNVSTWPGITRINLRAVK